MLYRLYISLIDEADYKRAHKISDRLMNDKRVSKTDQGFHDWYNDEVQRLHGEREALKGQGWDEFHNQGASIEDRAAGIEKVIYSHWHRAFGVGAPDEMTPEVCAGHWLHAQRKREWFEGDGGRKIFAILCARYPIPRQPRLKEGCTYVWITPEKPTRRPVKKALGRNTRRGASL